MKKEERNDEMKKMKIWRLKRNDQNIENERKRKWRNENMCQENISENENDESMKEEEKVKWRMRENEGRNYNE